jgi:hypothetical protein
MGLVGSKKALARSQFKKGEAFTLMKPTGTKPLQRNPYSVFSDREIANQQLSDMLKNYNSGGE